MSRWSIVDPAVVVPAGAVEEILRELRITYFEMPHLFGDAASAVEFAARYRLVANERTCPKCGGMMKLWRRKCTDSIEVRIAILFVETMLMVCMPPHPMKPLLRRKNYLYLVPIPCSKARFTKV